MPGHQALSAQAKHSEASPRPLAWRSWGSPATARHRAVGSGGGVGGRGLRQTRSLPPCWAHTGQPCTSSGACGRWQRQKQILGPCAPGTGDAARLLRALASCSVRPGSPCTTHAGSSARASSGPECGCPDTDCVSRCTGQVHERPRVAVWLPWNQPDTTKGCGGPVAPAPATWQEELQSPPIPPSPPTPG